LPDTGDNYNNLSVGLYVCEAATASTYPRNWTVTLPFLSFALVVSLIEEKVMLVQLATILSSITASGRVVGLPLQASQVRDWSIEEDNKVLKKTIGPGCSIMLWRRYAGVGLNKTC